MTAGALAVPRPVRTVVVDDAEDLRTLLRLVLGRSGRYEVVAEAADGATAADVVAQVRPDLVLLDLTMPGVGGLEAIPLVRAAAPAATLVVLSGLGPERAAAPALAAGADAYLEKGLAPRELVGRLDGLLGHAATTPTTAALLGPAATGLLVAATVTQTRALLDDARDRLAAVLAGPADDHERLLADARDLVADADRLLAALGRNVTGEG